MTTDYLIQIEALMSRIAEMRAAHQEPRDISPRTPDTISTQSNSADNIERGLRADGHRIWGFVVYRCTYASNSAWEACIQRINASIQQSMTTYNGHDLLEEGRFKLTIIDDASKFDGASTSTVPSTSASGVHARSTRSKARAKRLRAGSRSRYRGMVAWR